jgi:hypothetical protein
MFPRAACMSKGSAPFTSGRSRWSRSELAYDETKLESPELKGGHEVHMDTARGMNRGVR